MRGLQKRGQQVVPLKYRRETPLKPIPVEALCDFEGDQVSPCPGVPGAPGRLGPDRPLFRSLKGLRGDRAGGRTSDVFRSLCLSLSLGSLSASALHPPHPPTPATWSHLAFCPTSLEAPVIPADVSGKVLIGPLLSHVFSLNQSLWL